LADKDLRINGQIRVREVRLIREDGEQGIMSTQEALELAKEQGLDLVEVAPQANPPVVKILDYGKYKFENEKKVRDSKKKQKLLKLKEIRMQPKIDDHDLDFKSKHVRNFLSDYRYIVGGQDPRMTQIPLALGGFFGKDVAEILLLVLYLSRSGK
jgi:translation initiation factor IF-3